MKDWIIAIAACVYWEADIYYHKIKEKIKNV